LQVGSFASAGLTAGTSSTQSREVRVHPGGVGLGIAVLGANGEHPGEPFAREGKHFSHSCWHRGCAGLLELC